MLQDFERKRNYS